MTIAGGPLGNVVFANRMFVRSFDIRTFAGDLAASLPILDETGASLLDEAGDVLLDDIYYSSPGDGMRFSARRTNLLFDARE